MTNLLDLDGKDLEREINKIIDDAKSQSVFWSEKEIEILKRLHGSGVPYRKMAETLGRTIKAVENKTHNLGFTRPTRKE